MSFKPQNPCQKLHGVVCVFHLRTTRMEVETQKLTGKLLWCTQWQTKNTRAKKMSGCPLGLFMHHVTNAYLF